MATQGVHFVGSAPWSTPEETFTHIASLLPGRLRSIPDGEACPRDYWVWRQHRIFPNFALNPVSHAAKCGVDRGEPDDGPLQWMAAPVMPPARQEGEKLEILKSGYDDAAIASYETFKKLREAGVIEKDVRFQVSLPSAFSTVVQHVHYPYKAEAEMIYEAQLLQTLERIQNEIPPEDLAIQFDLAVEMAALEHACGRINFQVYQSHFEGDLLEGLVERLVKISEAVKQPALLGYHYCYGDIGHEHFVQPQDAGRMMSMANLVAKKVKRPIDWIHIPVPRDRFDEEYFKPIADAKIDEQTVLYLGVVRECDLEGTERRTQTATKAVKRPFGIATECGMGRIHDTSLAEDIIRICSRMAEPVR